MEPGGDHDLGHACGFRSVRVASNDSPFGGGEPTVEAVSWVPDAQCAWQILLQCAGPRCHHLFRTVPPTQSVAYAHGHDDGMWRALEGVLGRLPGNQRQIEVAHSLTSLPMRLGGLGLRSAARIAPAAYWASWADALEMLHHRLPVLTEQIMEQLAAERAGDGCMAQLCEATRVLDHAGFVGRPTWTELSDEKRPPPPVSSEPDEWQYHASSFLEYHFRETVIVAQPDAAEQTHLRSHAGPPEFKVEPQLFRVLVLERLRLPLDVTDATCECGSRLDLLGRHRAPPVTGTGHGTKPRSRLPRGRSDR